VSHASDARSQHPNAPLTPEGRRRMVGCVVDQGWSVSATAERFQVDTKTVRKWRDRFLAEGEAGLRDRSSRPCTSPNRTPPRLRREVIRLRRKRRWGASHIAHEVGLAASTVQAILRQEGLGRLDRGDRATNTTNPKPQRYQREHPGELIHVDVKKLAGIPPGGGWRTRGRGYDGEGSKTRMVGYRFLHSAVDDRTRIVYSEILNDEQAVTAAGFWARAAAWYLSMGITCERVITDNGACYRSGLWHRACAATGTQVKKTRQRRPLPHGKIERFHRILLEEWAYVRPWTSETQRTRAYAGFIHFYNHHRSHGSLGWSTPTSTLKDNLPAMHS
jgi:transposase-like protein